MDSPPDIGPIDLLWKALVLVGVPALILLPIYVLFTVAEWVHLGRLAIRTADRHIDRTRSRLGNAPRLAHLLLAQTGFLALVYVLLGIPQLVSRLWAGEKVPWEERLLSLLTLASDDGFRMVSILVVLGITLAIDLAVALRAGIVVTAGAIVFGIAAVPIAIASIAATVVLLIALAIAGLGAAVGSPDPRIADTWDFSLMLGLALGAAAGCLGGGYAFLAQAERLLDSPARESG